MIVICEECGKKYRIDPDKIKGSQAKFQCKNCSHEILIQKPAPSSEPTPSLTLSEPAIHESEHTPSPPPSPPEEKKQRTSLWRKLGIRGKMILLFFLLPGIISGLAALYTGYQIEITADEIVSESEKSFRHLAELALLNDTRALADQLETYLSNNLEVQTQDLMQLPYVQNVVSSRGTWKGETFIYTLPQNGNQWVVAADQDEESIGVDLKSYKERMGDNYPAFLKVFTGVRNNKTSRGYFTWVTPIGQTQQRYMVAKVVEGTPYVVAKMVNVSDMLSSVSQIREVSEDRIYTSRLIFGGIMLLAFAMIGLAVSFYGHRLTGKIKYLTDASDQISVGDLDTEIHIKSEDELGDLAEAISRMQDSLRLSIQRLRRRR